MIEQFVNLFYTENWEQFATQKANQIIRENLFHAQKRMTNQFWTKLTDGWFHDAYLMQLHCEDTNSLNICVRKNGEMVRILFSPVSLFECVGALLDHNASFPHADHDRPIAQILDIWVELVDEVSMFVLLDNGRYLHIKYGIDQILANVE